MIIFGNSMDVKGFSSQKILLINCYGPPKSTKPLSKSLMLKHNTIPFKKPLIVRSSLSKNQVFENRTEGIICYINDTGEIICEGYDEGPRFHQYCFRARTQPYHLLQQQKPRDRVVVNLLQQRLLQIVNGGEFTSTAEYDT